MCRLPIQRAIFTSDKNLRKNLTHEMNWENQCSVDKSVQDVQKRTMDIKFDDNNSSPQQSFLPAHCLYRYHANRWVHHSWPLVRKRGKRPVSHHWSFSRVLSSVWMHFSLVLWLKTKMYVPSTGFSIFPRYSPQWLPEVSPPCVRWHFRVILHPKGNTRK